MPSYPSRFSAKERDWLVERLKQADVRAMIATAGDGYLKAIADLVRPEFEQHWTEPYDGESLSDYEKRRSNAHKNKKANFPRRGPETQEAWEVRRSKLGHNVHRFVIEHFCTKSKRKRAPGTAIPVPDVQQPRKTRRISALDVYQGEYQGDRDMEAEGVASSSASKFDIGGSRADAAKAWQTLPLVQREPYETRARMRNQEREIRHASEPGVGEEVPAETPLSAQAIGGWLKLVLEKLGAMNWGGFVCAGGPDENGEIRTYIDFVGYNRHGENLLETVTKAACFSNDELESLVTLWVEQAKTNDSGPANGVETLPYHVLRALQIQKQKPDLPPPEILAAVLSEAFDAQKIALRTPETPAPYAHPVVPAARPAEAEPAECVGLSAGPEESTFVAVESGAQGPPVRASHTEMSSSNPGRPHIPDPLVDGAFGFPGPFMVDTSGIDFQWGGEYALMNDNPLGPDSFSIPTSNVRTDIEGAPTSQVDTVGSVVSGAQLPNARVATSDVVVNRGPGEPCTMEASASRGRKTKKAGSGKARKPSPAGVLMPDAYGAETRARPQRERHLTQKGQNYAAERSKARRK